MAERTPTRQSSASTTSPFADQRSLSRQSNPDIFSDDFALEPLAVTDGLGPSSSSRDGAARPHTPPRTSFARRSIALQPSTERPTDSPKKKKTSQLYGRQSAVNPRQDAGSGQDPRRTPSTASVSAYSDSTNQRPLSTISSFTIPRTQSPYQGATGPSHPYAMYPQDISLNRQSTISTIRGPERPFNGSSGPTHPYGMYPQNTVVPEGDLNPVARPAPIAQIGFPGLVGQSNYTRRLGPDGEDADDIIGPDGHTEQLPPYTRYPDALPSKERYAPDSSSQASPPNSPRPGTRGSHSDASDTEDNDHQINLAAAGAAGLLDESGGTKEKWSKKGKRRTCFGTLPLWALILGIVGLVMVAAVAGGVIGRYVGHKSKPDMPPSPQAMSAGPTPVAAATVVTQIVTASLVDVSAIATATNLPVLPIGPWGVPLGVPSDTSTGCLQNQAQAPAWECITGAYLDLDVTPSDIGPTTVTLSSGLQPNQPFNYGAQPPFINGPAPLTLVMDLENPTKGPALVFTQMFDKIVVIPTNMFNPGVVSKRSPDSNSDSDSDSESSHSNSNSGSSHSNSNSGSSHSNSNSGSSHSNSNSGSPHSDQNSGSSNPTPDSETSNPTSNSESSDPTVDSEPSDATPGSESPDSTSNSGSSKNSNGGKNHQKGKDKDKDKDNQSQMYKSRNQAVEPGETAWFCFWNGTVLEGFIYVTLDTPANASSLMGPPIQSTSTNAPPSQTTVPVTNYGSSPGGSGSGSGSGGSDDNPGPNGGSNGMPAIYPRVMRIEERRLPNPPVAPYCQQMTCLNNGGLKPVLNNVTNEPIIVHLNETEPAISSRGQDGWWSDTLFNYGKRDHLVKRDASCHCDWFT